MADETKEQSGPRTDRYYSVAEVATLLRLSRMTVYRMLKSGELKSGRFGRQYRMKETDLHDYLREAFEDRA